ncbi:hypothetical protein F5888DRAFT_1711139 [Russula emetica]|nr:hypothetical protein F5888DRAFT_1711139 [Russula emetica]
MITRVGSHINIVQRDLSILSYTFLEPDSCSLTLFRSHSFYSTSPFRPTPFPVFFFFHFVPCISGMATKLLSLYFLAIAGLEVVRAAPLILNQRGTNVTNLNGTLSQAPSSQFPNVTVKRAASLNLDKRDVNPNDTLTGLASGVLTGPVFNASSLTLTLSTPSPSPATHE